MESKNHQQKIESLEANLFTMIVYSHTSILLQYLQKAMNKANKEFKNWFQYCEPIHENEIPASIEHIQDEMFEAFSLTDFLCDIFFDFEYAINENNDEIYFDNNSILDMLSNYLELYKDRLIFEEEDPIYNLMFLLYYGEEQEKKFAKLIIIDFVIYLYGFIIYRDYLKLLKFFNRDFLIAPNDNHIPIRIALLNTLNLISDLNNTVPNKENIYRIVHAIVGGNEDNVKKYCLSLIGNSLSQKQITRKHKEFAQKYINEKKL